MFKTTCRLLSKTPQLQRSNLSVPIAILDSARSPVRRVALVQGQLQQQRHYQLGTGEMEKVYTDKACPPAGPYTQAIKAPPFLFVSGQIPADAQGNLVEGSIADKTRTCIQNITAILEASGTDISQVVKTTVFLDDMGNFGEMNGEYEKWFAHRPARSCVAVRTLPKGVPVEIECIVLLK